MGSSSTLLPWCLLICCSLLFAVGSSQTAPSPQPSPLPRTDPAEAKALNSIFGAWGISSLKSTLPWNTTGDPCTGAAVNASLSLDDMEFNPGIKCNCSYENMTVCHITELKVYKLLVEGPIPEELTYLTKLYNLQLQWNRLSGTFIESIQNLTAMKNLNLSSNTLSGPVPKELGSFLNLVSLDLSKNSLSGPVPKELGSFLNLVSLDLSSNALSGPLPKELGSLLNLVSLDLSENTFSGSVPDELGNLVNLEQLKMNSIGVSGIFPMTFSKLQKLRTLWISDNNFSGSLPTLLGELTGLEDLRLQGNTFLGPVPPSFSNLKNLTRLQIGELLGTSSNLQFLENMTSLTILIVRNSQISGSIPSFIEKFMSLNHLDLSFNNLGGQIASSIFLMPTLGYLFLGNNSLTGNLPSEKSSKLLNIDLSYNKLSGNFPSWVTEADLNLNLVWNNFLMDNTSNSFLPGLRCLQSNIPCHLNSPIYNSFAVICGGTNPVTQESGPVFESDSAPLSAASYYVTNDMKWAVSTVGRFLDVQQQNYVRNTETRFVNTQDSDLFQTARLSPSSIRYYGLGLQNGDYTVELRFGEVLNQWDTVKGRRLFDIYIQGGLVEKDFDISQRAGNATLVGVIVRYSTHVTDNFLEIHFFWAGKGTCCVPSNGNYGPSISSIKVTQNLSPSENNGTSNKKNKGLVAGIVVAVVILCSILIFVSFAWRWKRKLGEDEDKEMFGLAGKPHSFTYQELRTATENFSLTNKLGVGGFGSVFKGTLSDGKVVAVKQLSESTPYKKEQFVTEIATISAVQHRNLVRLHGFCYEGNKKLIVLEYLVNGSLDKLIFGEERLILDWNARFRICLGIARGLAYLHEETYPRIIHRDIKASNILLDADFIPKITDFGIAKLYDDKKSHLSTGVAGTIGYLAPEYAMKGLLTEKADVFSFGVLLFEMLCGRRNTEPGIDAENVYLLEWVWRLHNEKRDLEMLDPALSSYNEAEALQAIGVAFMCTQAPPARRPTMPIVVSMLVGDVEVGEVRVRPSYLLDCNYTDVTASSSATPFVSNTSWVN